MVSTFYNVGFLDYVDEYHEKMVDTDKLIQRANFVDA